MPSPAAFTDPPESTVAGPHPGVPGQSGLALCSDEALALLTRVEQAIWLYDLTHHRVVWANRAALALWKATDPEELKRRNFDPTAPGTAERLANMRLRLARGDQLTELWVLYPLGEPLQVRCRFTGVLLANGEIGMMVEALPSALDTAEAHYELRAIEAIRHAPLMISLASPTGRWLMHNPAAETLMHRMAHQTGPGLDDFARLFADPSAAIALRIRAMEDGAAHGALRLAGEALRVHEITIRRLIDPASGQLSLIVSQQDVTRAHRLEQRLHKALVRERALTELQRQFLAITSHDFRTPLSIIDGAARRIEKLAGGASAIAERAESIRAAVLRMSQSIDKTLASEMIAEGKAAFRPEAVDLGALLGSVVDDLRGLNPEREIALTLVPLPLAMVDRALAERVFQNLLANALKYSPPGTMVTVQAAQDGPAIAVTVADHGMGIPAEDLPQVFTRYFRARNTRRIKGTGVGLHAVRTIMELHGGKVDLSSQEDRGTTIRVTFPLPPG